MKKQYSPVMNIGSISLLMTFIVLCLVVFATLSLSGAIGEYQYSKKIALHEQEYYRASNHAVQTLREVDRLLHAAYESEPDRYYTIIEQQLSGMGELLLDFTGELPLVTYEVPVSGSQVLRVVLALSPPGQMQDGYYHITTWQEAPSLEWNGDDSLDLIQL